MAKRHRPLRAERLRPEQWRSLRNRFNEKYVVDEATGCWLWTAGHTSEGYGVIFQGGGVRRQLRAHRVSYELLVGPIPEGMTLDHLCDTPACVNPAHLVLATDRENILRGSGPPAQNARKTYCKHGHEFTPENTYLRRTGGRRCRTCDRATYQRKRAERA